MVMMDYSSSNNYQSVCDKYGEYDQPPQHQHVNDDLEEKASSELQCKYHEGAVSGNFNSNNTSGVSSINLNNDGNIANNLPCMLLMGPRRGGKTSIQRVVFQKMSPHETLFRLEATQQLERAIVDHTPLCRFTVWDFPGDYYGDDDGSNRVFISDKSVAKSLIFVVDAQDEPYDHVLSSFTNAVTRTLELNPNIAIEVFINKVDGELFLSDESKYDCRRDIMTQVTDELVDSGVSPDSIHIRYHLTSIYDHSIYEALSRVVQRLIPQLPTLENLLNVLVSTCLMEKAYLFDVVSKLYISTDPGPVDVQSVELCSDMIDVVLDVSGIYGLGEMKASVTDNNQTQSDSTLTRTLSVGGQSLLLDNSPNDNATNQDALVGTFISQAPTLDLEEDMVDPDSAYDCKSASVIRLSNGMVLYLKEVDTMLALVCITRAENFRKKSLINHNIGCLKKALKALVQPLPSI